MTADSFRRLALTMPEALEVGHMGHPDFRVGGKIFATLGHDKRVNLMIEPEERRDQHRRNARGDAARLRCRRLPRGEDQSPSGDRRVTGDREGDRDREGAAPFRLTDYPEAAIEADPRF